MNSMKYLVNWIPLNTQFRFKNTQRQQVHDILSETIAHYLWNCPGQLQPLFKAHTLGENSSQRLWAGVHARA